MRPILLASFLLIFVAKAHAQCNCWIEPDSSYTTIAPGMWFVPPFVFGANALDDGAIGPIQLPFTFQFLGVETDSIFINTNGALSMDYPMVLFNATGFPNSDEVYSKIIAPFWGDVDLRGSCVDCNRVSYKVTPTALYVSWHRVGYWSFETDLLNSFQVILTDGTDPAVPNGNNVSFCYGNMQWATSDGNGGANGYGGVPATVGVNQASGADVRYAQIGRFGQVGAGYNGPYGEGSGVDWLDSAQFVFNTADSIGVPPIFAWQSNCDTIVVQVGEELEYDMLVLAGGIGQSVGLLSECPTVPSYTELSNTQGEQAMVTSFMAPDAADIGFHTITYVAQDDQDTPLSAAGVVVVQVVPDLATGLSASTADPLFIAPNPVGDVLHYSMGAHAPAGALQILGTDGRLIRHLGSNSANAGPIDVHDLAPGTYFLRSAGMTRRFIKD